MSKVKKLLRVLKSIERSNRTPTPVQINVIPSYKCDLNCSYCYQHSSNGKEMSFEDFKIIVKKAKELHGGYFNFTGGEPLSWSPLIDAITFLTENDFGSHLTSNGFLLNDTLAEKLGKAELDILNISLDGIEDSSNLDKILARHDDGFTDRLKYLKEKYDIKIKINGVITQHNIEQIPELLSYGARNNFVVSLGLEVPDLSKTAKPKYKKLPEKIKKSISTASKQGFIVEPPEYFENPKFDCYAGKQKSLSINPDLEMLFCNKTGKSANTRINEFKQQDYNGYLAKLKEHIEWCNPLCASNCAYMGHYFVTHPVRAIKLFIVQHTKLFI